MAVTINKIPSPPVAPKQYGILDALRELPDRKETLMLVHKVTGEGFRVLDHDPQTGLTKLKSPSGGLLQPKLGEREEKLYDPLWR